jgi:O-antigen/teichoic acid export membrane protein/2-polyprenyl-3-methyl-5-hydroxy-6-metoxy-1,4-benzoquinol methylase
MRDGVINASGFIATRLLGIFLVPIMLKGLGVEMYGLWLAASSLTVLFSSIDFGLGWGLVRVVSASYEDSSNRDADRFISCAAMAFVLLGTGGALLTAGSGLVLSGHFHLSSEAQKIAPAVFVFAGIALFGNQVLSFGVSVFHGLRRFDIANYFSIAAAIVWTTGVISLLALGVGLEGIAAWQALISIITGFVAILIVTHLRPRVSFHWDQFSWSSFSPHVSFSIMSQLSGIANKVLWEVPPLLIGFTHGPASIVPYGIGQRIPLAISGIAWRAAEVLFPAASETTKSINDGRSREILEVGTRYIALLMLPLCLILWVFGSELLRVWMGEANPIALVVLQLTTAAIFVDAAGTAASHILWGRGEARTVLVVSTSMAVMSLALTSVLLHVAGVAQVAWGTLIALIFGSGTFLYFCARECDVRISQVLSITSYGLFLPLIISTTIAVGIKFLGGPRSWFGFLLAMLICGGAYGVVLCRSGLRKEERMLLRESTDVPRKLLHSLYRRMREMLREVRFARSSWYLILALVDYAHDCWRRPASFDQEFLRQVDPWGYATSDGREHHVIALEMLDHISERNNFDSACEVGCAEGVFTDQLAPYCNRILALDYSQIALSRARKQSYAKEKIQFEKWNVREDQLHDTYDLIVIMDVLSSILRPVTLKAAYRKLVSGLNQGGYFLVVDVRQSEVFEWAWWGKSLLRGAKWINATIGEHPDLKMIETRTTKTHVFTLFQKVT